MQNEYLRRLVEKRNQLADKADKFYKTCIRPLGMVSTQTNVLRYAETMPEFRTELEAFDANPMVLNCQSGTIELRDGTQRAHSPKDLITKLAPVAYVPDAPAPLFERVLSEALPDPEVRAFFHRFCGYSVTGAVSEDLMVMLVGSGGNGKSTLLNAIAHVLGDYAGVAPKSLLMTGSRFSAPTSYELADLRGKRFVQVMELNEREHLDTSRLKSVVGGDRITARQIYQRPITFTTQAKILMPCNSLPRITDDDNGPWRRIAVIEFPTAFLTEPDRTLPERLRGEAEGILAWLVRGCLEWQRIGLAVPEACRRRAAEYRHGENDVAQFVDECVERGEGRFSRGALYQRFKSWAQDQGGYAMGVQKFNKRLRDLAFSEVKVDGAWFWSGIKAVRQ